MWCLTHPTIHQKYLYRDFPCGPAVNTLCFHHRGCGTKILQAEQSGEKLTSTTILTEYQLKAGRRSWTTKAARKSPTWPDNIDKGRTIKWLAGKFKKSCYYLLRLKWNKDFFPTKSERLDHLQTLNIKRCYMWFMLMFGRSQHNTIKWLSFH